MPTWIKLGIPLLVALYFLSPFDLIPDFLIGPGQLDDLGIVLLGMTLLIRLAPGNVVEEHRRALGMDIDPAGGGTAGSYGRPTPAGSEQSAGGAIEGEYRVIPPDQGQDNNTRKF